MVIDEAGRNDEPLGVEHLHGVGRGNAVTGHTDDAVTADRYVRSEAGHSGPVYHRPATDENVVRSPLAFAAGGEQECGGHYKHASHGDPRECAGHRNRTGCALSLPD